MNRSFGYYFGKIVKWYFYLLLFCGFIYLLIATEVLGKLPQLDDIKNPQKKISSVIYSEDMKVMGKYYIENRTILNYKQISPNTVNALLSTEDIRFREHAGIDMYGLSTAMFRTFVLGRRSGASTITQQLAKNLFHSTQRGKLYRLIQKLKEWYIAVQLEKNFSKDEIISLYFNTVPFLHNSFGLKEAANTYFSKEPINLTVDESAVLVGMLKGPGLYNPKTKPENAKNRRNVVLSQMAKAGFISNKEAEKLKKRPLKLKYKLTSPNTGIAPYLREQIRVELNDILANYAKADGTHYNIYADGLKVYTTINSDIQKAAERSMKAHMMKLQSQFNKEWNGRDPYRYGEKKNPELILNILRNSSIYNYYLDQGMKEKDILDTLSVKELRTMFTWEGMKDLKMSYIDSLKYMKNILQVGLCSIDPQDGRVKAWIGGIDFYNFKYDHVRKSTKRQVGSTIKPLLYTVAIENGDNPCTEFDYVHPMITGYEDWNPKGTKYFAEGSKVKLKEGLQVSDNRIAAHLIKKFSPHALIEKAEQMGIEAEFDNVPSICLGITDVSVYEMVGAYSPFMNLGIYSEPFYIERIEDKSGNVIYQNSPQSKEVLNEKVANTMNIMMQQVSKGRGTAQRLRSKYGLNMEIACKTGTTQSNSDGWFIGSTPGLLTAIWVGADDPSITFASTRLGQGANSALPIWAGMYKTIYSQSGISFNRTKKFFPSDSASLTLLDCSLYEKKTNLGSSTFDEEQSDEDMFEE